MNKIFSVSQKKSNFKIQMHANIWNLFSGFVILNFTVYGPQWSCKEHKIKSLAPKYKDVWKVESR